MENNLSFSLIDKKHVDDILPELYDILYNNMSIIAPTGNSYEDDKNSWSSCIISALEKPQRNIILIYEENIIIGFFMYYIFDKTLMMEEIQFKAEYHGTGVFNKLYRYLFAVLTDNIEFVEAYANKKNQKSLNILSHLGLEIIGENKNGSSFHYRGEYQTLNNMILKETKAMIYEQALNYIHSLNRFGIKPGLERITVLLNELGNPHLALNCIHVAGTNGKGSTSTALSNILKESGKKTGLFISPFVVDFRERIQINGEYISELDLARLTEKISLFVPKIEKELGDNITEFEFITALMFTYFKEQNCDAVVLEVGLGGRLDSTNVIKKSLVSVITKIALDHISVLGDTICKIAYEKCGIIKEHCPVITSSLQNPDALSVIQKTSSEKISPLNIADASIVENLMLLPFGSRFNYKDMQVEVNLPGSHQVENMVTVIEAALTLGCPKEAIVNGIAKTRFPARLEVISKNPLVILDGAHNENGADVLAEYLDNNNLKPVTLIGMMADKNCEAVIEKIASRSKAVYTVKVKGNPRAQTAEMLLDLAKKYCAESYANPDYYSALTSATSRAKENNLPLLICGSLYLASDIREMAINYFNK